MVKMIARRIDNARIMGVVLFFQPCRVSLHMTERDLKCSAGENGGKLTTVVKEW